jgi:RHS repeat-associated protein
VNDPTPAVTDCTITTVKSGAIISTVDYDAFGNGGSVMGYGFTGREFDPETGLLYYRARYYDPKVGRFLSPDPVGYLAGPNLYSYVENDPVNLVDPYGLDDKPAGPQRPTYTSPDNAAVSGLTKSNPRSIEEGYESCFAVCEQGGTYFNTRSFTNYVDSGTCPYQSCPQGSKRVAICHTHGRYGNPGFSGGDIPSGEVSYVADPLGNIRKYDPKLPGNISQQQKSMCRGCAK